MRERALAELRFRYRGQNQSDSARGQPTEDDCFLALSNTDIAPIAQTNKRLEKIADRTRRLST
jgi:hypothetical protein